MNRICWWLADVVSRTLEPDEREAIYGDFAEASETGRQALLGLLGLVVRRQLTVWKDWRAWLALAGLAGVVSPRLYNISVGFGFPVYMDIWTYWQHGVSYSSGLTVGDKMVVSLCVGFGLLVWSWTSGFVLGCLSRRTLWVTGTLYFLIWIFPILMVLHFWWNLFWRGGLPHASGAPIILLTFAVQIAFQAALFVLPSIFGLRLGLRKGALNLPAASVLAAVTVGVTMLTIWTGGWPHAAVIRWGGGVWDSSAGWQHRLFSFGVLSWPAAYLLALALSWRQTRAMHPR